LNLLGWTQQEIGEAVSMDQPHISENIRKLKDSSSSIISDFYARVRAIVNELKSSSLLTKSNLPTKQEVTKHATSKLKDLSLLVISDFYEKHKQPEISEIITKLKSLSLVIKSDFFKKYKSIEEIRKYYSLDEPLAWAILLEGKTDQRRLLNFLETLREEKKAKEWQSKQEQQTEILEKIRKDEKAEISRNKCRCMEKSQAKGIESSSPQTVEIADYYFLFISDRNR
jgi:hypothetical protein